MASGWLPTGGRETTPCLAVVALALLLSAPGPAAPHGVAVDRSAGDAVLLTLREGDGAPFARESYEIRLEGEDLPFQSGRTDANGRIAFAPGRAGTWRLTAQSEDGHGIDMTFETGAVGVVLETPPPWLDRHARVLAGVGLILGAFGLWQLLSVRRPPAAGGAPGRQVRSR